MKLIPSKSYLNSFIRSIARDSLIKTSGIYTKRSIWKKIKRIRRISRLSICERDNFNANELAKALLRAQNTEFYKSTITTEVIEKVLIDTRYLQDLVPITKKTDLQNDPYAFTTREFNKASVYNNFTNGSSGPSALIFYDGDAADKSSAVTWWCRSFYENIWKNTTIHLATDLIENSLELPKWNDWIRHYSTNRFNLFISSWNEGQSEIKRISNKINKLNVNMMHGHPSVGYSLANELHKYELSLKINYFESSGETLFDYQKEAIERHFKCKLINRYGLAEAGIIAYQFPNDGEKMRVIDHSVELEENIKPEPLIFTTKENNLFSLIRYECGDVGHIRKINGVKYVMSLNGRKHKDIQVGNLRISSAVLMDIINHRLNGVIDFQLKEGINPILYMSLENNSTETRESIIDKLKKYAKTEFEVYIIPYSSFKRKGIRDKFVHWID